MPSTYEVVTLLDGVVLLLLHIGFGLCHAEHMVRGSGPAAWSSADTQILAPRAGSVHSITPWMKLLRFLQPTLHGPFPSWVPAAPSATRLISLTAYANPLSL